MNSQSNRRSRYARFLIFGVCFLMISSGMMILISSKAKAEFDPFNPFAGKTTVTSPAAYANYCRFVADGTEIPTTSNILGLDGSHADFDQAGYPQYAYAMTWNFTHNATGQFLPPFTHETDINVTLLSIEVLLVGSGSQMFTGGHFAICWNWTTTGYPFPLYPYTNNYWLNSSEFPRNNATSPWSVYWNITSYHAWNISDFGPNDHFRVMWYWNSYNGTQQLDYLGINYHYGLFAVPPSSELPGLPDYTSENQINGLAWLVLMFLPPALLAAGIGEITKIGGEIIFIVMLTFMLLVVWISDDTFFVFMLFGIIGTAITFYKGVSFTNTVLFSVSIGTFVLVWTALLPVFSIVLPMLIFGGMLFMNRGESSEGIST